MRLADWEGALERVPDEPQLWIIQVAAHWFVDSAWFRTRDRLDLLLFRRALSAGDPFDFRRIMLYDPPSDLGGNEERYRMASREHQEWIRRVRRQLAACGASGSAGKALPDDQDYAAKLLILDRVGAAPPPRLDDGLWPGNPPNEVAAAWELPGLIPLDPHEETIIGPHRDRNPLWQGAFLD
jgi:hypothetical protein